jgi:hypothetical protein
MEERREYDRLLENKFDMIEKLFNEKFDRLHDISEQTLAQAKKTNGRVTKAEDVTIPELENRLLKKIDKIKDETETIRFIGKRKWALGIIIVIAYAISIKEFRDLLLDVFL